MIFFAHPYPLSLFVSYSSKRQGEGVGKPNARCTLFATETQYPIIEHLRRAVRRDARIKCHRLNDLKAYTLRHPGCPCVSIFSNGVRHHAQFLERPPVRLPHADEEPWLRHHRHPHPGPRHGCQHHSFQCDKWLPSPPSP